MIDIPDFESLYRREPDPWSVATSFYEQRRLALVLAALTRPRYRRAWDPACGTGHLAARLAIRCDTVTATDAAAEAVRLSEGSCRGLENVELKQWRFPVQGRPGRSPYDLVVLSEFLYYLSADERSGIGALLDAATATEAEVLAVHWRHRLPDGWLSGVAVQEELAGTLAERGWRLAYRIEDVEFDLAGWRRGVDHDVG